MELFITRLYGIWKSVGVYNFITYLKASLIAMNQYIGGTALKDTQALGIAVKLEKGLPYIIPAYFRRLIRAKHVPTIQIVASVLYSYKALHADHIVDPKKVFGSIQATPLSEERWTEVCTKWLNYLDQSPFASYKWNLKPYIEKHYWPAPIMAAGPNNKVSMFGVALDYMALKRSGMLAIL
jgi:hypothetical protein